jgi:hypothetical protein
MQNHQAPPDGGQGVWGLCPAATRGWRTCQHTQCRHDHAGGEVARLVLEPIPDVRGWSARDRPGARGQCAVSGRVARPRSRVAVTIPSAVICPGTGRAQRRSHWVSLTVRADGAGIASVRHEPIMAREGKRHDPSADARSGTTDGRAHRRPGRHRALFSDDQKTGSGDGDGDAQHRELLPPVDDQESGTCEALQRAGDLAANAGAAPSEFLRMKPWSTCRPSSLLSSS